MWRRLVAASCVTTAGYLGLDYYRNLQPFPILFESTLKTHDQFLIYKPNPKKKLNKNLFNNLETLNLPVFSIHSWFDPTKDRILLNESETGLYFIKKLNGKFVSNSLERPDKLKKWVDRHENMYNAITSKKDLENILKNRKKHESLDLMILAYVPEGDADREKRFKDLVTMIDFQDPMYSYLMSNWMPVLGC